MGRRGRAHDHAGRPVGGRAAPGRARDRRGDPAAAAAGRGVRGRLAASRGRRGATGTPPRPGWSWRGGHSSRESNRSSRSCGRRTRAPWRWYGAWAWSGSARQRSTTACACRNFACAPGIWRKPREPVSGPRCDDGPMSEPRQVTDNQAESRFELRADGSLAELLYRRVGNRLVLIHTEVPEELEGRGIGGALVAAAVDRAAREGLTWCRCARSPAAGCSATPTWPRRRPSTGAEALVPEPRHAGRADRHRRLGGLHQERQRLLEVELDAGGVVGQVADRQVLAEVQLVVAAAGGQQRTPRRWPAPR